MATGINKEACLFDVANSGLNGTLKNIRLDLCVGGMFVVLLKCLKGTLESKGIQQFPGEASLQS